MGLVRDNIPDDVEALTQWVYRKLRNHHPMAKRENKRVSEMRGHHRERLRLLNPFEEKQGILPDKRAVGYVTEDGKAFLIKVEEVPLLELKKLADAT